MNHIWIQVPLLLVGYTAHYLLLLFLFIIVNAALPLPKLIEQGSNQ